MEEDDFENLEDDLISRRWIVREEELDDEQYKIRILRPDNYLIEGCAGSGKTILALHKAKEIQDSGVGTYLVVIYTLTLKTFIEDGISSLGLDSDRVCIYDRLDKLGHSDADYIIVDEVQDFPQDKLEKLISMANKHFIFFGDDVQQLYARGTDLNSIKYISGISNTNHKKLEKNYRLPVPIAHYAQYVATRSDNLVGRCIKQVGEKPLVMKLSNLDEEINYIFNLIKSEGWTDVGILCDTNDKVTQLVNRLNSMGIEVEYKYKELKANGYFNIIDNLNFYSDKPKITTYHSSKGLQFEHVFLPMCEVDFGNNKMQDALYVAITRASIDLFITYSGRLSPYLSGIPRDLYDHQNNKGEYIV